MVFLNNSETVKALNLASCRIQKHVIRNIHGKFGIPNLLQYTDIGQNSDEGVSDFRVSSQSLVKKIFHNSRTNNYIDMGGGGGFATPSLTSMRTPKEPTQIGVTNVVSLELKQPNMIDLWAEYWIISNMTILNLCLMSHIYTSHISPNYIKYLIQLSCWVIF